MRAATPKTIVVVSAPARSRGCAEVAYAKAPKDEKNAIIIAIGPKSYHSRTENPEVSFMRRLSRLFEHEVLHTQGFEHSEMQYNEAWSYGSMPEWAKGHHIRYVGRAPSQL